MSHLKITGLDHFRICSESQILFIINAGGCLLHGDVEKVRFLLCELTFPLEREYFMFPLQLSSFLIYGSSHPHLTEPSPEFSEVAQAKGQVMRWHKQELEAFQTWLQPSA